MPVPGQGIIPPAGAAYNELTATTRRAFVPKMVVQIWNSSPMIAALLSNGHTASGGVSSVTIPVQGNPFVQFQWGDYSASFAQPAQLQGALDSEFDLKLGIIPIPFLGMEGVVQADHAIIPLIEARFNDATNVAMDAMATALFNNTANNLQFIGLPGAIDDTTNLVTYGNVNRNTNTWWKSKRYNANNANPTRPLMLQYLSGTVKNGAEMPSCGICGIGTWTQLALDFVGQENYQITPGSSFDSSPEGPRSAFRACMIGGVPIYADPYCPEGVLYFINMNYAGLYIHQDAMFHFSGFQSTIPNFQVGYVGVVLLVAELVVVKPRAMTRVDNLGFISL